MREQPPLFNALSRLLNAVESIDYCALAARESVYTIDGYEERCRQRSSGLMESGLSNALMVTYQFLGDAQRRLQPFDKSVEFHEEFLGGTEYVELLDAMEFFMSPMI